MEKVDKKRSFVSKTLFPNSSYKMEEVYIKENKNLIILIKLGGCNVLWGTANNFGSGSPSKRPIGEKENFKVKKR